ncbi:DUF2235 domain-containing protein [Bradyrhizobium sp. 137]|uniref:T6SS phospholipase effector Tle1-like catalytic domain-containing protein n=1 Tax=Bradyrhizobium sp. 137 TaxID=2782614 RepID=UPI001FF7705F|nr:DUF2235 domain-containing protein [Bradyrhizobium sp. 137]MCK1755784.1 DUF2235 domain-containing protein [Bradyrhizobium sp. 137]
MFFFDGSSNVAAGAKAVIPTNVFRLNRAFTYGFSGIPQITFYFSGVGTRRDRLSAATGAGFDEIVIEAYVNLASNFLKGDEIYLFGFSRGAAAARALSGLISHPGLLPADFLDRFPELWRHFTSKKLSSQNRADLFQKFESQLHGTRPIVQFLGAFDTVAGSDWDRMNLFGKVRFNSLTLDNSVERAVQILAIDDDRNPSFSPLLWDGKSRDDQVLEQIWMPGVHADIGGCSNDRFLGDVALLTMLDRIRNHCPKLEIDDELFVPALLKSLRRATHIEITNERTGLRKLLAQAPRSIGVHETEFIHSIFNSLADREFTIKGTKQRYDPTHYNRRLDVLPMHLDEELYQLCKLLLREQPPEPRR